MNNLQRILKYASNNNYVKFEETMQNELAKRISTRLENNKKTIAANLFKENLNEVLGIPDIGLTLKPGDRVKIKDPESKRHGQIATIIKRIESDPSWYDIYEVKFNDEKHGIFPRAELIKLN